jgi:hypothetical protein
MFVQEISSDVLLRQKKSNRQIGIQFRRQCAATHRREAFNRGRSDKYLKRTAPAFRIKEIRRVGQPQNHFTKISWVEHQMRSFAQADLRQEYGISKRIRFQSVRGSDPNCERIRSRDQASSNALPSKIDRG